MPEEAKAIVESFSAGDVGPGARVAVGKNISWVEAGSGVLDGEALKQRFDTLLEQIARDSSLDEDTRELAKAKVQAVAEGLAKARESSGALRLALLDAKSWFGGAAAWVGRSLRDILRSEAAQKTIATMTESGTVAAIKSFLG